MKHVSHVSPTIGLNSPIFSGLGHLAKKETLRTLVALGMGCLKSTIVQTGAISIG